jgi:hypothetical protein
MLALQELCDFRHFLIKPNKWFMRICTKIARKTCFNQSCSEERWISTQLNQLEIRIYQQ